MPSVNPDIKAIADRDPVMRELLGHQAYFLYKDWQLFRERKPAELARRLERRMVRGFVVFAVLGVITLALAVAGLVFETPTSDTYYLLNLARLGGYPVFAAWMARHFYRARQNFRALAERLESGP